jgi:hypothetical protein
MKYINKLQLKWGLKSKTQVFLVLLVFSLTGSTVVFIRRYLFEALGFTAETSFWIKTITYILLIFPLYQVFALAYGFMLGQFDFFWEKEKKMFNYLFSFIK